MQDMAARVAKPRSSRRVWCAIAVLVAVLVMFVGGSRLMPAHAVSKTEDLIVEVQPSSADAALWSLVRGNLATVDAEAIETGEDPSLAELKTSYDALHQLLAEADTHRSFFKLIGIPGNLAEAFERGSLPQSALFSAAADVTVVGEDEVAKPGTHHVTVTESMTDKEQVLNAVDAFKAAYGALSESERILVSGNMTDFEGLTDEVLTEIARRAGPQADAAQLQLDRRLAASFPDMSAYSNGLLPSEALCAIPWDTRYQLHCSTIDNFSRLNEAYKAEFGTDMPILSGYRPLADQYAVNADSPNMTAIPGTSNHGWGLAVDFDWDVFDSWDAPEVKWMIENGPRYGWRHPSALNWNTDRPEPWHYEFGTMYGGSDSQDFDGPVPEVVYHVKSFG